jgi:hypothetical protein
VERKINERRNTRREKRMLRGKKKQMCFYTKESEIKNVFYTSEPMFILLYKETYFNANKFYHMHTIYVFLLQEFKDMFFKDVASGLPLIRKIEHQIYLTFRATIPNNHPI